MAWNPQGQVGIANEAVQYGVLIETGYAGPTKVKDYGHKVFAPDGTELTDPEMEIPAGAQVYLGRPGTQSQTGGEVVTGTDLVDQAERIRASQDASRIAQEQVNIQREQLAQQAAQYDKTFQITQEENARRYELDKALLGEQTAMRLFQERTQEAAAKRDEARIDIERQRFALEERAQKFQMADTLTGRKMDIQKMLAERSGPQDWVAYNNLLNGFQAPDPTASQTIDVFDTVRDLESQIAGLQGNNAITGSASSGGSQGQQFNGVQQPQGQQGAPVQTNTPPPQPVPQQQPNGFQPFVPQPGQIDVFGAAGGYADAVAAAKQNPVQRDRDSIEGSSQPQNPYHTMPTVTVTPPPQPASSFSYQGGAAPWLPNMGPTMADMQRQATIPGLEHGGMMGGGTMAVTGESKDGQMNPELVVNLNPKPEDKIAVIPLKQLLAQLGDEGVPMAESGGVYETMDPVNQRGGGQQPYTQGEQLATGKYTYNTYDPKTYGSMPFIQKLQGKQRSNAFQGFGAGLRNLGLGLNNFQDKINVRDFANFSDSEQQMTQDLYQRGLGVNFADIFGQSQRAAPYGQTLPVSTYGGR